MKLQLTLLSLLVCASFAAGAWAQSDTTTGSQTGNPADTATAPSVTAVDAGNLPVHPLNPHAPPNVGAPPSQPPSAADRAAANHRTGHRFATLDRNHQGYLTPKDVASDQYLTGHFKQCDLNGDGHLSNDEFASCLHQEVSPEAR